MSFWIMNGDSTELVKESEPDSIDAIVTDPPYELGFMGKSWDRSGVAFDPYTWWEMLRVLKPGGKFLFSEHGLAPDESVRRWQRRLQPIWGPLAGGCKLSIDIPALLESAGFTSRIESRYIPGPRFASYHYWGEASVVA